MRVHGDVNPPAFTVEKQPKHSGYYLVRVYKNAVPYKSSDYEGWEYEEYHLEMRERPDLQTYVQNHYNELFQEAKGGPSEVEQLRADMDYILLMGGL